MNGRSESNTATGDDTSTDSVICLTNTASSRSTAATTYDEDTVASDDFSSGSSQGRLAPSQVLYQLRKPLRIYNDQLPRKKHHDKPEGFKLFRSLFYYWQQTGETTIDMSVLGALLRAVDSQIFYKVGRPKLTTFLDRVIKDKFPVNWLHRGDGLDFEPMIDLIEEKEAVDQIGLDLEAFMF
ncbi:hypothetical protein CBS101457_002177 [Exobasidium rhododendri]|nr:hypothetical protein CBS101457_002177 [Exobasidium rhododendri]